MNGNSNTPAHIKSAPRNTVLGRSPSCAAAISIAVPCCGVPGILADRCGESRDARSRPEIGYGSVDEKRSGTLRRDGARSCGAATRAIDLVVNALSVLDRDKLRRGIEGGRPDDPAPRRMIDARPAEPDGSAAIGALFQLDVRQPVEAERSDVAEHARADDQDAPVRDGVSRAAAHPGVENETPGNHIKPDKYERHAPEPKQQGRTEA